MDFIMHFVYFKAVYLYILPVQQTNALVIIQICSFIEIYLNFYIKPLISLAIKKFYLFCHYKRDTLPIKVFIYDYTSLKTATTTIFGSSILADDNIAPQNRAGTNN